MQFFINFLKVFDEYICAECPPNLNFGDAIAVQEEFMYEIFSDVPPRTKILAPPLYTVYILYIYQLSLVPPPPFLYVVDPMHTDTRTVRVIRIVSMTNDSYSDSDTRARTSCQMSFSLCREQMQVTE